jgi:predicted ATPase
MIKYLKIENLNGFTSFENSFHDDVNIITGLNGSGKTSVLRLAWYLMSANIERVFDDCIFDSLKVETTHYTLTIIPEINNKKIINSVDYIYKDNSKEITKSKIKIQDFRREIEVINQLAIVSGYSMPTIMFPTFRRIEGGYSYLSHSAPKYNAYEEREYKDPIEMGLHNLSQRLGVYNHKFVTSISTQDIKNLLTQSYAEISRHTNMAHTRMAKRIESLVTDYNSDKRKREEGYYLKQISDMVKKNSQVQGKKLAPFNHIGKLIEEFFESKSIKITEAIKFGKDGIILDSDVLSAGEKQFLGFLAYNALLVKGTIFIDEPELSLHVDWQRKLLSALRDQNASNQLVIATHSPFIYSMYEDKELSFSKK